MPCMVVSRIPIDPDGISGHANQPLDSRCGKFVYRGNPPAEPNDEFHIAQTSPIHPSARFRLRQVRGVFRYHLHRASTKSAWHGDGWSDGVERDRRGCCQLLDSHSLAFSGRLRGRLGRDAEPCPWHPADRDRWGSGTHCHPQRHHADGRIHRPRIQDRCHKLVSKAIDRRRHLATKLLGTHRA